MTKFTKSLVADLDHAFTLDNRLGYKVLTAHTFLVLGMLAYSVGLEMGWIVM